MAYLYAVRVTFMWRTLMGRPRKYEEVEAKKIVGGGWVCDGCIFRDLDCHAKRQYMIDHGYKDCQSDPVIYKEK